MATVAVQVRRPTWPYRDSAKSPRIDSGGFRVLKCSCWVSTTVQRLVGFRATGGLIASVTAGNMPDKSRFNERPMLRPISKVEKCARQDNDVFAVVSVRLGYLRCFGGRRERDEEIMLALWVLVYYGGNPVRGQTFGHVAGWRGIRRVRGSLWWANWAIGRLGEVTKLHKFCASWHPCQCRSRLLELRSFARMAARSSLLLPLTIHRLAPNNQSSKALAKVPFAPLPSLLLLLTSPQHQHC